LKACLCAMITSMKYSARSPLCSSCSEAHDYGQLVGRWKRLSARAGFRMRQIAASGGFKVYGITTAPGNRPTGGYISAGIHGDEPSGPWALLKWAELRYRQLVKKEWVLFPCLNPWGLAKNSRRDSTGRDLNRSFHHSRLPVIRGWKKLVGNRRFPSTAVMLHEDYDGDGIYAYCLGLDPLVARRALAAACRFIPLSVNPRVDRKWRQQGGIVRLPRRRQIPPGVEAGYMFRHHALSTTTIETPSELSFDLRIKAHMAYLDFFRKL